MTAIFIALVVIITFCAVKIWGLLNPKPSPNTFSKNDSRLDKIKAIQRGPDGRYLCEPEKRLKNYSPHPKRFYTFLKGEQLPEHLVLVFVADIVVTEFTDHSQQETIRKARIDLTNLGYNALIDCRACWERFNYLNYYTLRGRPALIVSKNYPGSIDPLEDRCSHHFENMIYGKPFCNQDP